jgi:hypothetical protein
LIVQGVERASITAVGLAVAVDVYPVTEVTADIVGIADSVPVAVFSGAFWVGTDVGIPRLEIASLEADA